GATMLNPAISRLQRYLASIGRGFRASPSPKAGPHEAPRTEVADRPLSFADRAEGLRVLAIGDGDIASVELTLAIPLEYLSQTHGLSFRLIYANQQPALEDCRGFDLIMAMRVYDPHTLSIVRALHSDGVPVIYMTDDDLELIDPQTPLGQALAAMGASAN